MDKKDILRLFEGLSDIFKALYQKPLWQKYNLNDSIGATSLFLEGYAFERQGRSPSFSPAAVEAIKKAEVSKSPEDFPLDVWLNFSKLLNDSGLNRKLNPLCPQFPLYHPSSSCNCIWCVLNGDNIIDISRQALIDGQTKNIWERLKKIQGVGPKIASLFLRDVAIWYGLPHYENENCRFLGEDDNRWLLQPVDIWIRRIVVDLNKPNMNKETKNEVIAKWIVKSCDEPEFCNQGMWYFGARIAKTEFQLENYLKEPKKTIEEHINSLKANAQTILELKNVCQI